MIADFERESALWKKVEALANEKIDVLRKRNDGDLDETETARLRGRIAAWKELLAWGEKPNPALVADEH